MNKKAIALVAVVTILCAALPVLSNEHPVMQLRIHTDTPQTADRVRAMGFDVIQVSESRADVFCGSDDLDRLRRAGYNVEVIHDDVVAFYADRLATYESTDGSMGGYKTLAEIYQYLDDMKAAHPGIMTDRISIGQTLEGRDIFAVKISDNPDVDEDEPELSFNACIHACEVITPEVLLYFMDHLTDNYGSDPEATQIVDNRELWFVLVINPDGYYHNEVTNPEGGGVWRKNRRDNLDGTFGVDLNRNFGYGWGWDNLLSSPNTWSERYRGPGPFSEPETQVIRDFVNSRNFVIQVDYHSYQNSILNPWAYEMYRTEDWQVFWTMCDSMSSYNGYLANVKYISNGNCEDWSYGEQTTKNKVLPILVEVGGTGDGFWPELDRIPELVQENLGPNLYLCRVADHVYSLRYPKRPDMPQVEFTGDSDYSVSWFHDDTANPAVAYELVEYQNLVWILDSADNTSNWTDIYSFHTDRQNYHSEKSSFSAYQQAFMRTEDAIYIEAGDTLTFWTDYDLFEGYTYAYAQISTDGYTFERIPGNLSTDYDPIGVNHGYGITGSSGGWVEAKYDLSAYAGQSVMVAISYNQEWTDTEMQCPPEEDSYFYIDDIYIIKEFETETSIADDLTEDEFSFSAKPEGDYYYRVRAVDTDGQWGDFSEFCKVIVSGIPSYVCGDANGDGVVTHADVGFLIEYLHKDGPAPDPFEAGDADGDGDVDKDDASYLIAYLHKDGPEPICP